ncbi:MAG: hypothetical protein IJQ81_05060 [Oscillibacter sp.]|nr:hypothetical protein [Oscillibacter sp.]
MEPIGTEAVETPELIPARAVIRRDVYVKYARQNCKKNKKTLNILCAFCGKRKTHNFHLNAYEGEKWKNVTLIRKEKSGRI